VSAALQITHEIDEVFALRAEVERLRIENAALRALAGPRPQPLTRRQREVLDHVIGYQDSHRGESPTIRDLIERLGITETAVISHLDALASRGWIRRMRARKRGIDVLFRPEDVYR
jgi:DNA-binding MarR family transcriptional regulator